MRFFSATLVEALDNLRINPLRTLLALIGIAIGCAAVVSILQIGFIAERQILEDLDQAGLNLIVATPVSGFESPGDGGRAPIPSAAAIETRLKPLSGIRHAALVKEHNQEVQIQGESVYMSIIGVTPSFVDVANLALERGSFEVLGLDVASIGILGSDVTANLTRPVEIEVGDHVRLGFDGYEIGGLLAPSMYNSMIGLDLGRSLLVPEKSLERLTQDVQSWRLVIEALPSAVKTDIEARVRAIFLEEHGLGIDIQHAETLVATKQSQQRSFTLLLTALGGVALVVGTVGVANVMLASVAERRVEIGLRMAVGASPRDISTLFLCEAIMLCFIGGLLGAMIGIIGSNLYASLSLADVTISYAVLVAALLLSTVTGLVSGYYPARQSARLDPVSALQEG